MQPGGEIFSAYCSCTAGMYGTCNHIAGLLFSCEHAVKTGQTLLSCTSKPCQWNMPKSKPVFPPQTATSVSWRKGHYLKTREGCEAERNRLTQKKNFTPYSKHQLTEELKMREMLHAIASEEVPDSSFALLCEKRRLQRDSPTMPKTITEMAASCSSVEELADKKLTEMELHAIKVGTLGQTENPEWFQQRKGRITASIFKRAITKSDSSQNNNTIDCSNLVETVLGEKKYFPTKAMKHGISLEPYAKTQYTTLMRKHHRKFKSHNTGLQVSSELYFLAASSDLETMCECCGEGLCEIKCPESVKDQQPSHENVPYLVKSDGGITLDRNHQYYYQVQGQMAICKRPHCDFFVFTYHGNVCIRIPFNEEFWMQVKPKLSWFWLHQVAPVLLKTSVESQDNVTQLAESSIPSIETLDSESEIVLPQRKRVRRCLRLTSHTTKQPLLFLCGVCGSECKDNPEDAKQQSVCCDICDVWVHYVCAGLTDESVKNFDKWCCQKCKKHTISY